MKQVGVYYAKTHLSQLLDDVEPGEAITITRHGKPVAQLVPVQPERRNVAEVIEASSRLEKGERLEASRSEN